MRITGLEAVGFSSGLVRARLHLCMYGRCVCVRVCGRACVSHLFVEQKCPSVFLDRHLAMSHWP